MIGADLHSHTLISHGSATVSEMYAAAKAKGLEYFGFSEHSPLPDGFECGLYVDGLEENFPAYVAEVLALKNAGCQNPKPLLALELDWLPTRLAWMRELTGSAPYDYVLGSLHYLDGWSVGNPASWGPEIGQEQRFARFAAYFCEMASLAKSGLAQIASHPDFIKLRVWPDFQKWLATPQSRDPIAFALEALKKADMAMEINSAGLRWPFREPYPAPPVMLLAKDIGVNISFGGDAHCPEHIGADFDFLADYAHSFGFAKFTIFIDRQPVFIDF